MLLYGARVDGNTALNRPRIPSKSPRSDRGTVRELVRVAAERLARCARHAPLCGEIVAWSLPVRAPQSRRCSRFDRFARGLCLLICLPENLIVMGC
jgi:hypothetical protein